MVCDMERAQIHPRLTLANHDWLLAKCREADLSLSEGLNAILSEAREAGVSLRAMTGQVIRP